MLGKNDGAGVAATFDHAAEECGNDTRPFASTAFNALPWKQML